LARKVYKTNQQALAVIISNIVIF